MTKGPNWRIDTHAHVFTAGLPLAPGRRYSPSGEAPLAGYLDILDAAGMTGAVLIQPSFLGADNAHMAQALRQAGGRLRGIAVVNPDVHPTELQALARAGVVGIRLNLVDAPCEGLSEPAWQHLFERIGALGWQVEVHAESTRLPRILERIGDAPAAIVIDHLCRAATGTACPGVRGVLRAAESGRIWVKMSAPFRCGAPDWRAVAWPLARMLVAELGPERLVWGSDRPWTQHESGITYESTLAWLSEWVPDADARHRILGESAARLYRFVPDVPSEDTPSPGPVVEDRDGPPRRGSTAPEES